MKKEAKLFVITIVALSYCFLITGCNDSKKMKERPTQIREVEFLHLQRHTNQLYYYKTEKAPYTGKVVEYWDSAKIRLEFYCKDGLKDSTEKQWFMDGKLKSKSKYKRGLPVDTMTKWYDSGQKMVEAYFENGLITGKMVVWYLNGKKFRESTFSDGEKNGFETTWLNNGDTNAIIQYKNNQTNGFQIIYNMHGIDRNVTKNTPVNPAIKSKNFIDIAIKNKDKNRVVLWDNIRIDSDRCFVLGEKVAYYGKIACLYPNKKVKWIEDFVNGIAHGNLMGWHPNGALKYTMPYYWGQSFGLTTGWTENGKIEWEGVNTLGATTGISREYENGIISRQVDMIQGVKYGTEITYYSNGMKKSIIEYVKDEKMSERTWDENGREKKPKAN